MVFYILKTKNVQLCEAIDLLLPRLMSGYYRGIREKDYMATIAKRKRIVELSEEILQFYKLKIMFALRNHKSEKQ